MTRRRHDPDTADQLVGTVRSHTRPGSNTDSSIQQGGSVRRLTPTECERLQSLPDQWTLTEESGDDPNPKPDGPRYAACGDAVTANVAEFIGRRLLAQSPPTNQVERMR